MSWLFNNKPIVAEEIPEETVGFIYIIEHKVTKKRYLGKKLLTKAATKMVNGKKKKIRKPSDWESYWSSSPWLIEILDAEGRENFDRHIVMLCTGKGEMLYAEESLQYRLKVLESDMWYNSNIRSRVFKKTVAKYNLARLQTIADTYSSSSSMIESSLSSDLQKGQ
jgi:hypothetical protein